MFNNINFSKNNDVLGHSTRQRDHAYEKEEMSSKNDSLSKNDPDHEEEKLEDEEILKNIDQNYFCADGSFDSQHSQLKVCILSDKNYFNLLSCYLICKF